MEPKKYNLPKEFATKWVEALRNTSDLNRIKDDYTDNNDCYCGFGLGLKVAKCKFDGQTITSTMPTGLGELEHEIVELNDTCDFTFSMQADWLEANVNFI